MEYFDKAGNLVKLTKEEIIEMALGDDSVDMDIWIVTDFNDQEDSKQAS